MQGTSDIGTVLLSGSRANFSKVFGSVGTKSASAVYSGDANFASNTSAAMNQIVSQASTMTTLISSMNPSAIEQTVTLTATVTAACCGTPTPTGTVTFMQGTGTVGTVSLSGGNATLSKAFGSAGTKSITAIYSGGIKFTPSTSPPVNQVVN
jgi:hypothetical protein